MNTENQTFSYSWISRNYWFLYFIVGLLVCSLFIFLNDPEGFGVNEFVWIFCMFLFVLLIQYYFLERKAKYWSVSTTKSGLLFRAKEKEYFLSWGEIERLVFFPESPDAAPLEWSKSMFSSGVLIYTTDQRDFVIYKKINGYKQLLQKIKSSIEN